MEESDIHNSDILETRIADLEGEMDTISIDIERLENEENDENTTIARLHEIQELKKEANARLEFLLEEWVFIRDINNGDAPFLTKNYDTDTASQMSTCLRCQRRF